MTEQIHKSLTLTRVLNAPREIVFEAWTVPEQLAAWWGPGNFTNPVCQVEAKEGGAILIHMCDPGGHIYPMTGTIIEFLRPEKLVFTSEAHWNETDGAMMEILNTVTFENENGKTKLTVMASVRWAKPEAELALAGMEAGWSSSLDKLAAFVKGVPNEK